MTNRLRQLVATLLLFFVTGVHAATSGISTAYFVDADPAASLTQSPPVNAQYQTLPSLLIWALGRASFGFAWYASKPRGHLTQKPMSSALGHTNCEKLIFSFAQTTVGF
jgi:hypothetical protein